jgi:multicomponent Na+:H+ antiporter subunit D
VLTPEAATAWVSWGGGDLWGSVEAVRQQRLKVMVAYSTVAQVGYLFLLLPLTAPGLDPASALAWHGGMYHAVSHAWPRPRCSWPPGTSRTRWVSDRIVGVSGIATHLPISTYAFGLAGMSLRDCRRAAASSPSG